MTNILKLEKADALLITAVIALIMVMFFLSGEITHPDKRIEDLANQIKTLIGISNFLGLAIMLFSIIMVIEND